jgi:DNA-binding NtrC family response regulator
MPSLTPRVLIFEAHSGRGDPLAHDLRTAGYDARVVLDAAEADAELERFAPEVAIVNLTDTGDAGADFMRRARERLEQCAVVCLTDSGAAGVVAHAVRTGADLVIQSGAPREVVPIVARALEKARATGDAARMRRRAEETLSIARFDAIVGSHPLMQELLKKVAYVAGTRATVLVSGESGTGKELIAAAIHHNSRRRLGPFVRLNCAALADSVLESELFGHERGAFTGAIVRREGRFKQSDAGTLFLDEISEISPSVQVKLLRFLQDREFERVGGNETVKVDVRVVAATNRDQRSRVAGGKIRAGLYKRQAVV